MIDSLIIRQVAVMLETSAVPWAPPQDSFHEALVQPPSELGGSTGAQAQQLQVVVNDDDSTMVS